MARPEKARLGEILVQQKLLTQDPLDIGLILDSIQTAINIRRRCRKAM